MLDRVLRPDLYAWMEESESCRVCTHLLIAHTFIFFYISAGLLAYCCMNVQGIGLVTPLEFDLVFAL